MSFYAYIQITLCMHKCWDMSVCMHENINVCMYDCMQTWALIASVHERTNLWKPCNWMTSKKTWFEINFNISYKIPEFHHIFLSACILMMLWFKFKYRRWLSMCVCTSKQPYVVYAYMCGAYCIALHKPFKPSMHLTVLDQVRNPANSLLSIPTAHSSPAS